MNSLNSKTEEDEFFQTVPPKDIFAFNELRSCADLKRMFDKKQLDLYPDFQREEVWKPAEKARFLDSLLKNLPIPSMCLSLNIEDNKRIVIDGLQRISTIIQFLSASENIDDDFKLSALDDIDSRLSGKKVSEIMEQDSEVIAAIENVTIPVTVLRCMFSRNDHMEYIFTIFHRLNTGGTKLNAQEIRNCIFNGNLNYLLFECAKEHKLKLNNLLGTVDNKRFAHEEFILRFFAFNEELNTYQAPLTRFLNNYMKKNKDIDKIDRENKYQLLQTTLELFNKNLSNNKDLGGKVFIEAVLYGIAKNISFLSTQPIEYFNDAINNIKNNQNFSSEELNQGTFKTPKKVIDRFNAASEAFSG